jgi:ribosomal protein S18 acetylase RimI-like enzyme
VNKDVTIGPTAAADTASIGNIAESTGLFPADMLADMISGYLDGSKADIWLTARSTAGVVGFAFCEPERLTNGTWNLLAIGVSPELQRQGIGAELVRHLEDRLRGGAHRVLLVETLGTPEFERTRSFYLKNGFVQEARIREFYDVGGDKIVFWKHLWT